MSDMYVINGSTLTAIADSIRAKTGSTATLSPAAMPTAINGITGSGGGGTTTDERVKYVTFMYGDVELYKQPVIAGDTCKNPVTLGLIETPTKESTAQYDYTHSGWSLTDGGSATSYALTNVTEDRTVYAAFSAAVRYYTVTYYDEDGTTVLHTESLAYGSTPSYVPAKQDYTFDGWTPNTTVTGDTSYTASWSYGLDFANMTWAEIDAEIQAGNASKFAIGSQKSISYNYGVNARIMTLTIVGINHDDLSDGSGKAGITVDFSHPASSGPWGTTSGASNVAWNNTNYCYVGQYLSDLYEKYMPSDLKQVIKTVRKTRYDTGTSTYVTDDVTIFPPAIVEIMDTTNTSHRLEEGTQYVGYANGLDKNCWTRTKSAAKYAYQYDKSQTGDARAVSTYVVSNNENYSGMFCIYPIKYLTISIAMRSQNDETKRRIAEMDELEVERRLSHVEERAKSNTRRIDEVEKKQEDITDLIQSVATIAQKQTDMDMAVQEIKTDVKTITGRPARRWDSIVEKVLRTVVAALVGWVLLRLGIGV